MATTIERDNLNRNDIAVEDTSDSTWIGYMLLIVAILAIAWAVSAFVFSSQQEDYNNISFTTGANQYEPASGNVNNTAAVQPQAVPDQNANTVTNSPAAVDNSNPQLSNDPYRSANNDPAVQNRVPQSGSY